MLSRLDVYHNENGIERLFLMLNVALCQINPWVGNLSFNLKKIKDFYEKNTHAPDNVDLVVFPECAVTGYPLEDLVLKPHFMEQTQKNILEIAKLTQAHETAILVGSPWRTDGKILNTAVFIEKGKVKHLISKKKLPNYGVFDEKRIFVQEGFEDSPLLEYKGYKIGVLICEDMWDEGPARLLKEKGAEFLVVINGSPFDQAKEENRYIQASRRVKENKIPLLYVNMIGGQDSLVFDGRSFVMNQKAEIISLSPAFEESCKIFTIRKSNSHMEIEESSKREGLEALPSNNLSLLYKSLVLSLRDYVRKNNFKGVLIGLSGGIDSAISAAIAVDALGKDKVSCIMMPSPYTSAESLEDAQTIAKLLDVSYEAIPIEMIMEAYSKALSFKSGESLGTTQENIQARIRGMILMALSNKTGFMVLSTGNKSEMAVGYATLYGDMCGGFNCLKDVYKTQVFELSRWRNEHFDTSFLGPKGLVMSDRVITKAPSAELKPNQKDQDSLPEYAVLDKILFFLIEQDMSVEDIIREGFNEDEVKKVARLLDGAEYKRRQAPPGPKVTEKALSGERRYPITNGFVN